MIRLACAACAGFFLSPLMAQERIERQVQVIKPYEPSVSDAFKISLLPVITDTVRLLPDFQYSIFPSPLTSDFKVDPISPARMTSESMAKLYNSHLKLGVGSYVSPFAEFSMNTIRSKEHTAGIWLSHYSSHAAMNLENGIKTYPAFSDNEALAYGTKFFRTAALAGDIGVKSNGFHYYGVQPDSALFNAFEKEDLRQNFLKFSSGVKLYSFDTDSSRLNYDIALKVGHFRDRNDLAENALRLKTSLHQFFNNQILGADLKIDHFTNTAYQDSFNTVLSLNPWITKSTSDWHAYAGADLVYDKLGDTGKAYFYPKASLQFNVVENYLIPYVGIDGGLGINNYSSVAYNNFFIMPGLFVENSNTKMNIYAGMKGNLGSLTSFNLKAGFSTTDNEHFFVNDTTESLQNRFNVIYDNLEKINYYGELATKAFPSLDLLVKGNIYKYSPGSEAKAWHMPNWDMTITANYNLQDKIIVSSDLFMIGKRYAKSLLTPDLPIELKQIVDLNLGLEYRYTKILSGFIKVHNIGAARYYKWNQYPTRRFSIVAGFSYSL